MAMGLSSLNDIPAGTKHLPTFPVVQTLRERLISCLYVLWKGWIVVFITVGGTP